MGTGRSLRFSDGGIKRLRRFLYVIDGLDVVVNTACAGGTSHAGGTAASCHDVLLLRLDLRYGDDDNHGCGG